MDYFYAETGKKKPAADRLQVNRDEKSKITKEISSLEALNNSGDVKTPEETEEQELYEKMREEEARIRAQFMFGWYY